MVQIGSNNHIDNRLRSSLIEQIIDKRQPLAERVTTVTKNLNDIYNLLQQVESQRNRLLDKVNEHSTINKLNQLNFSPLINQINSELVSLARLKYRFSRSTLNIGVVGRARQGKSRLLQSLTGLSKAEIPDGDGQHCTGVRSNIYHVTGIETYAEVHFHSEQTFLEEVITPYYQQLNLGSVPHSLELFANTSLPEIDKTSVALDKAKYEHLSKYHQYIDKYRHFFQQTTVRIEKERIREYVAQDTLEGKRDYYAYLAVQKVDIFCNFPDNDIGKISLVDMPGLGDTGIEDCKKNPKIPTVQDILKKRDRLASFEGAYAECQHEVRTNLSERFLHFDDALKDSLETAKSKVVKVLIDSGKLGNIVEGEGSEFLLNLLDKIPEDLSKLIKGFSTLATFELQYRGLIQHRVRKHLDVLTPDRTKYKLNDTFSNLFGQNNTNEQKAQKIYDNLLKAQKEAVENCKKELAQILIEPNQAGFAIVEEFVDRVLRAEGIREEWQVLLQEYAPQVWQEDYDVTNADYQLKQEWIYLVEDIEQKSQVKYFEFSI